MTADAFGGQFLIIGGSSGMGLALAEILLARGHEVAIVGRSKERLAAAAQRLGGAARLRSFSADVTSEEQVQALFATIGEIDHLALTAADVGGVYEGLAALDMATARTVLASKIIGALLVAKHGAPLVRPGGSITFTSGIAAYRPAPRGSVVAAANGALQSMIYALALELAPLRVNLVSPGWVDTPIWDQVAGANKAAMLDAMAKRLPVGRVGAPRDVAEAVIGLMRNRHITGTVLHVDGGQRLV